MIEKVKPFALALAGIGILLLGIGILLLGIAAFNKPVAHDRYEFSGIYRLNKQTGELCRLELVPRRVPITPENPLGFGGPNPKMDIALTDCTK